MFWIILSGIIPAGPVLGFLTQDTNLTNEWNLMKFWHFAQLIKLYTVSKFQRVSISGLISIMGKKPLVWGLWYDPTPHSESLEAQYGPHVISGIQIAEDISDHLCHIRVREAAKKMSDLPPPLELSGFSLKIAENGFWQQKYRNKIFLNRNKDTQIKKTNI